MLDLISEISMADSGQIDEIVDAAIKRYEQFHPQWQVTTISIDKRRSRNEQIDCMISILEKMKSPE